MRRNPPVDDLIPEIKRAIHGREDLIQKHFGVDVRARRQRFCGKWGCVFERDGSTVLKITKDPHEVRMVKEIIRLRKLPARVTPSTVKYFAFLGTTPQKASKLPGIVGYYSVPVKIKAGAWSYVREAVMPLDARKGPGLRQQMDRLDAAIDLFWYSARAPDPVRFLRHYPELRLIVVTALYLKKVLNTQIEDLHSEQVGVVTKTGPLHRAGALVLYDAQV